jgi:hypothetical protein
VPPALAGFAFFGGLAVLISFTHKSFPDFRPMTLRRQFSLALLFIVCALIVAQGRGEFNQPGKFLS